MLEYIYQVKVVYPKTEEGLIDFLNMCKLKDYEVMLCMYCSAIFNKDDAKGLENYKPHKFGRTNKKDNIIFDKRGIPHKEPQGRTYVPSVNVLVGEWVRSMEKTGIDQCKWKSIDISARYSYHDNSQTSKKYSYTSKNYLGKRSNDGDSVEEALEKEKGFLLSREFKQKRQITTMKQGQTNKTPVKQRLFRPFK